MAWTKNKSENKLTIKNLAKYVMKENTLYIVRWSWKKDPSSFYIVEWTPPLGMWTSRPNVF